MPLISRDSHYLPEVGVAGSSSLAEARATTQRCLLTLSPALR